MVIFRYICAGCARLVLPVMEIVASTVELDQRDALYSVLRTARVLNIRYLRYSRKLEVMKCISRKLWVLWVLWVLFGRETDINREARSKLSKC